MSSFYWTDDPEYDAERFFNDREREEWDERIDRLPKWMKKIGTKKYCKECAERIAFAILED